MTVVIKGVIVARKKGITRGIKLTIIKEPYAVSTVLSAREAGELAAALLEGIRPDKSAAQAILERLAEALERLPLRDELADRAAAAAAALRGELSRPSVPAGKAAGSSVQL